MHAGEVIAALEAAREYVKTVWAMGYIVGGWPFPVDTLPRKSEDVLKQIDGVLLELRAGPAVDLEHWRLEVAPKDPPPVATANERRQP